MEEGVTRRPSLQAAGGAAKDQEEEVKLGEEGGSADSEQGTTETDGEEGNKSEHCEPPPPTGAAAKYVSCRRTGTLRCSGEWPPCAVTPFSAPRHPPIPAGGRASSA